MEHDNCSEYGNETQERTQVCQNETVNIDPKSKENKTRKGCMIYGIPVLALILIIAIVAIFQSNDRGKDTIEYRIASTSTYAVNSQQAKGYRVVVDKNATRSELIDVFEDITDNDGYSYHTVWFYSSWSSATGGDIYDIAMVDDDDGYVSYDRR